VSRDADHRRALEALHVAHERGLYNVAYRVVWNRDDARDVVQDALVRLWRKRDRIDWPRAPGLAYRIVLGLAANRRRGNAVRAAFGLGPPREPAVARAPDVALDDARLDAAVRRAIDELPARLRDVLLLATFGELDHGEVAAALGIAVGTVGSRRHAAIARIRAALGAADARKAVSRG
jgi:RNA polymerase sigma-70 factor (ECF subfamily)